MSMRAISLALRGIDARGMGFLKRSSYRWLVPWPSDRRGSVGRPTSDLKTGASACGILDWDEQDELVSEELSLPENSTL